ncbi:MAG: hypothetical protein ABSG63_09935 [Spirochaetia bacterium]|jgi:hypothetical protein
MKRGKRLAASALCAALTLAACQTVPVKMAGGQPVPAKGAGGEETTVPSLHPLAAYSNRHGVVFRYPRAWQVEDATLNYDDLGAAGAEGGAYLQIYSYDRTTVADPTAPVPSTEAKIMISLMRNTGNLDYPELLGGLGDDIIDRTLLTIDGRKAWKVHYRILNQESGGKLDILSIFLIDQGYIVRFICYPWNSRYEAQFEELAGSFKNRGK